LTKKFAELVVQIRNSAQLALTFVDGMNKVEFLQDQKTQHAVVMALLNIGECSRRILDGFPETAVRFDSIPWHSMRGMRHRIAHGYSEINQDLVWETVTKDLQELIFRLNEISSGEN
jgi:uncharacterized protein with HEPN domain